MPVSLLSISLGEALQIVYGIIEHAQKDGGRPIAVAVVDASSRLIAFAAMEKVVPASIKLSQSKAYSAVIGQKNTVHWATILKNDDIVDFDMRNWTDPDFSGFTGGVVIIKDDQVIGGIGVSGRRGKKSFDDTHSQDHELAIYGTTLLNFETER